MDMEIILNHVATIQHKLDVDKQRYEEEKQIALAEKLNTNIDKFVESVEAFFNLWSLDELARLTKAGILQSLNANELKLDLANTVNGWFAKAHLVMPEATIKDILDASKVILAINRDNELDHKRYPDTEIFWYNSLREFSIRCKDYTYSFSVNDTMDMSNPIVRICKNN